MNPDKLTDQLDDPDEIDLTEGIKKQFPEERAVTFIKPVLHCESWERDYHERPLPPVSNI